MFHWICPECGREIPPSVRECQACDPSAAASPVVEPLKSAPEPRVEARVGETPIESLAVTAELPIVKAEPVAEPVPSTPVLETPVAKSEPAAPPVLEALPVAESASTVSAAEPIAEATPVVPEPLSSEAATPVLERPAVAEPAPSELVAAAELVVEVTPSAPVLETPVAAESAPTEPVAVAQPVLEAAPAAPAVETPMVAEPAPVEPVVAEPVVEAAPPALETPAVGEPVAVQTVAEASPAVEAPVLETRAVAEPAPAEPVAAEPAPVAEVTPVAAPEPVVPVATTAPLLEPLMETPSVAEPIVEPPAAAPHDAVLETVAAVLAGPDRNLAPHETPIKLHDVPDPLLALAEEIRAAQAARAAALAAPPSSAGLRELAEAVGVEPQATKEAEPVKPVEHLEHAQPAEPVSQPQEPAAPTQQVYAALESATAVALLAPPEPESSPLLEPVGFHELRQAALAPDPQPSAEPEPVALAEPQAQPVALAPEPQPEAEPEPEGPTLPFAPMQDYTPATSRSIQPVPPRAQILSADTGPRITLPGPTLPPELTRLQDANVLTLIGENTAQRTKEAIPPPKNAGAPGWLVSLLVMLLLLAAGLGVVFYMLPRTVADAKPAPTPAVAATTPAPTAGNSPLAKFVEVTGFRIVTSSPEATKKDAPKKSEVQYLIVNHSDADISDANVFVTLRSAKPGQAPLCRFSFKVPALGPFESKEMSSPIGNATRSVSLPDWQEIRAEVQISQ